jgi:ABC-type branched-subunit amino acid transport system substrate-binding protein
MKRFPTPFLAAAILAAGAAAAQDTAQDTGQDTAQDTAQDTGQDTGQDTAQDCDITVGLVMELTGPAGAYGQAGAKSVEMAFHDLNEAGGVLGCTLLADTRDSQSQGNVAVDQARQLVSVDGVPVIIGGIISSVSIPILTAVTAPGGVVQVSPASSSPTLTQLARDGQTGGYFFRTITSDALQGIAAARYAMDQGLDALTIIHVNNDFGVNMAREFTAAYESLGGTITSTTAGAQPAKHTPPHRSHAARVTPPGRQRPGPRHATRARPA